MHKGKETAGCSDLVFPCVGRHNLSCSAVDQYLLRPCNENGSSSFLSATSHRCHFFTKSLPFSLTLTRCCQTILANCPNCSPGCAEEVLHPSCPLSSRYSPERLVLFPPVRFPKRLFPCPRFSMCCSLRPTLSCWIAWTNGSAPRPRRPVPACAATMPQPPPRCSAGRSLTWSCSPSTRPKRTPSPASPRSRPPRRCSPSVPGTTNPSPCRPCAPAPRTSWCWNA